MLALQDLADGGVSIRCGWKTQPEIRNHAKYSQMTHVPIEVPRLRELEWGMLDKLSCARKASLRITSPSRASAHIRLPRHTMAGASQLELKRPRCFPSITLPACWKWHACKENKHLGDEHIVGARSNWKTHRCLQGRDPGDMIFSGP